MSSTDHDPLQIFERSVGDNVLPASTAGIPTHQLSEDLIPPALDASAETLVDTSVDPNSVEIVTMGNVDASVPNPRTNSPFDPTTGLDINSIEPGSSLLEGDERKRLSFISYADLVHAEHRDPSPKRPAKSASPSRSPDLSTTNSRTSHSPEIGDSLLHSGVTGEIRQSLGDTMGLNNREEVNATK
jgi:hypothetical protein